MPHFSTPNQDSGIAREATLLVLKKVINNKAELQAALDSELQKIKLNASANKTAFTNHDLALCTELSYGVLRKYIQLSYLVNRFLTKPEKLPPLLYLRLLIGAHELLNLDGIPKHASLHLTVEGIKKAHGPNLANLGNAVLRSIQRLGPEATSFEFFKNNISDESELWSTFYSLPPWIVQLWRTAYGDENAKQIMQGSNQKAPVGFRVNLKQEEATKILDLMQNISGAVKVEPAGVAFHSTPAIIKDLIQPWIDGGHISRQSGGSQEVLAAFQDNWNECIEQNKAKASGDNTQFGVWDACTGRGGKAVALLEQGVPVSLGSDISMARLKGFKAELKRLNLSTNIARISAIKPAIKAKFHTILLDAPCSGLGTLSRHPDISLHRTPADITRLLQTQENALTACSELLTKNGKLIYITCTLNPDENERQIEKLLAKDSTLRLEKTWHTPYDSCLSEFFWAAQISKK